MSDTTERLLQNVVDVLRREHLFYSGWNKERANMVYGICLDLSEEFAETLGWDEDTRKAFFRRLLGK